MRLTSCFTLALLTTGISAFANTYDFALSGSLPGTSNTTTLTSNGLSITVNGFNAGSTVNTSTIGGTWNGGESGTSADDLISETVPGVTGTDIGLKNGITATSYVQFSASNLISNNIHQLTFNLENSEANQPGEVAVTWDIWDSATANGVFTLLATGTTLSGSTQNINLNTNDPYIEVSGGDCVVLLSSITASTSSTPEPGTLVLILLGGILLGSRKLLQRFARKQA